jgi:hypothetical protein
MSRYYRCFGAYLPNGNPTYKGDMMADINNRYTISQRSTDLSQALKCKNISGFICFSCHTSDIWENSRSVAERNNSYQLPYCELANRIGQVNNHEEVCVNGCKKINMYGLVAVYCDGTVRAFVDGMSGQYEKMLGMWTVATGPQGCLEADYD